VEAASVVFGEHGQDLVVLPGDLGIGTIFQAFRKPSHFGSQPRFGA